MKLIQTVTLLVFVTGAASYGATAEEHIENLLIGSWACESGDCPDEEISFSVDEGIRSYNSWLHERPSAVNGTWAIVKDKLTIECCAGLTYEYTVVRVTDTEIVLRDAAATTETILSRIASAD